MRESKAATPDIRKIHSRCKNTYGNGIEDVCEARKLAGLSVEDQLLDKIIDLENSLSTLKKLTQTIIKDYNSILNSKKFK